MRFLGPLLPRALIGLVRALVSAATYDQSENHPTPDPRPLRFLL